MPAAPLSPRIETLNPPPIPRIQQALAGYDGSAGPVIDLSQAVPGYPPHPRLRGWLQEAAGDPALLGYGPIEGLDSLRKSYAAYQADLYQAPVTPQETAITSGCNQAFVVAALTVARPGESLLLITPFYFNHDTSLAMLGIGTKTVAAKPENGFLPDLGDIAAALSPDIRAIAVITPNNPTGAVYPPALLGQLFDLCSERNLWLILDETYRDFLPSPTPAPHGLFSRPGWQDRLISLYSFSKSFCIPGHRLGAITAGAQVIEAAAKIMDNLQICAPCPPQSAVAKGLAGLGNWREDNRAEIARRTQALTTAFAPLKDWQLLTKGAYFAYIRHPFDGIGSEQVATQLATTHGIATLPGSFFGARQEPYLRFAFANADADAIRSLTDRLSAVRAPSNGSE